METGAITAILMIGSALITQVTTPSAPRFDAAVLAAIDERAPQSKAIQALPLGDRHQALGMIGTPAACKQIREEIQPKTAPNTGATAAQKRAPFASLIGLSYCRQPTDAPLIIKVFDHLVEGDNLPENPNYEPFGILGGQVIRDFLIAKMAQETLPSPSLIKAVMQSFAYERLALNQLGGIDLNGQIAAADALGSYEQRYALRYLVSRLAPTSDRLPSVRAWQSALMRRDLTNLAPDDMDLIILETRSYQPNDRMTLAVRDMIFRSDAPDRLRQAMIRFFNPMRPEGLEHLILLATATDEPAMIRVAALLQMARAKEGSDPLVTTFADLVKADHPWVQATALSGLYQFDQKAARLVAADWIDGEDIYRLFKAASILSADDNGKSYLRIVLAKNADGLLADIITPILDTKAPAAEPARATPPVDDALKATAMRVRLKTTKGDIVIGFNPGTPFAAFNFITLVEEGLMTDTIFHRVIPNFVAQWGQSPNQTVQNWGRIRDNWLAGRHRYGAVGVATAGRDTGSAQFFINLMDLHHLTGRYTVVGQVMSGMGVAEALEEGDRVIAASLDSPQTIDIQKEMLDKAIKRQLSPN